MLSKIGKQTVVWLIILSIMLPCVYAQPNSTAPLYVSINEINMNLNEAYLYSVYEITQNGLVDTYDYEMIYDQTAMSIDKSDKKIFPLKVGVYEIIFENAAYSKSVTLCFNDPSDTKTIKGRVIYAQDFETEADIEGAFLTNYTEIKNDDGNKYLCVNGRSVINQVGPFGNVSLSNYSLSADMALTGTNTGASTAFVSFGLRSAASGYDAYRFMYFDAIKMNALGQIDLSSAGVKVENVYSIGRSSTDQIKNWTIAKTENAPNESTEIVPDPLDGSKNIRRQKNASRVEMNIFKNNAQLNVYDIDSADLLAEVNAVIDDESSMLTEGLNTIFTHNAEMYVDNIEIAELVEVEGLKINLSNNEITGIDGDNTVLYSVTTLDAKELPLNKIAISSPSEYVSVDEQSGVISVSEPGDYVIYADYSGKRAIASLKVSPQTGDIEDVKQHMSFGVNMNDVRENFELPVLVNGVNVYWSSSDTSTIRITGNIAEVTRPAINTADKEVTLFATFVKNGFVSTDNYIFKVRKNLTDEEAIDEAVSSITLPTETDANIDLPTSKGGVEIVWHSTNPQLISNNGTIKRPETLDTAVNIAGYFKKGNAERIQSYKVIVKGKGVVPKRRTIVIQPDKYTAAVGEEISYSVNEYSEYGILALSNYQLTFDDSALEINKDKNKIIGKKTGIYDVQMTSVETNYIQKIKMAFNDEADIEIISSEVVYEENFENIDAIDSAFKTAQYSVRQAEGSNVLYLDGISAVNATQAFGPKDASGKLIPLSDYVVQADMYMDNCTAYSASQLSFGLRYSGDDAYRVSYHDLFISSVDMPNLMATRDAANHVVNKNSVTLSRGVGATLSNWYYGSMNKAPDEIYDAQNRRFTKPYRIRTSIIKNQLKCEIIDIETEQIIFLTQENLSALDYKTNYSKADKITSGATVLGYHSTSAWFDNIKIEAVEALSGLDMKFSKNILTGNADDCRTAITLSSGNTTVSGGQYSCDSPNVSFDSGVITVSQEGTYFIEARTNSKYAVAPIFVKSDADDITKDLDDIVIMEDMSKIRESFILPESRSTSQILWESSNADYVRINGNHAVVIRPGVGEVNKDVILSATIFEGNIILTKKFPLTILALKSDDDLVTLALSGISLPQTTKTDIVLPQENEEKVILSWMSENESVLSRYGKVNRPYDKDVRVSLTVTASKGNARKSAVKTIIVECINPNGTSTGGTGGSGGGSGGSNSGGKIDLNFQIEPTLPKAQVVFTDLNSVLWAKEAVLALLDAGVVNGISQAEFAPLNNVKREEFIKMIAEVLGLKGKPTNKFSDVNENDWFAPYIGAAVDIGLISGKTIDFFGVGENITRQDMAVIIYRAALLVGMNMSYSQEMFSDDADIAEYAKEPLYNLKNMNIINGVCDNRFAPGENAVRAEAAVIIWRFLKQLKV